MFRPDVDPTTGLFVEPFTIAISGTTTDPGGTISGIDQMRVAVKNIQHGEYYCGPDECAGEPDVFWQPTFTSFPIAVDSPGAVSTTWKTTFLPYDHEHRLRDPGLGG